MGGSTGWGATAMDWPFKSAMGAGSIAKKMTTPQNVTLGPCKIRLHPHTCEKIILHLHDAAPTTSHTHTHTHTQSAEGADAHLKEDDGPPAAF